MWTKETAKEFVYNLVKEKVEILDSSRCTGWNPGPADINNKIAIDFSGARISPRASRLETLMGPLIEFSLYHHCLSHTNVPVTSFPGRNYTT